MRPFDSYPAAFYGLPKIYKILALVEQNDHFTIEADTEVPLRPINSVIGPPTYEISKYLARILKYLYNDVYTVRNSKGFASFIFNQNIEPNERIVSFDVTSLFTSIPVDLALQIVKQELNNTTIWTQHTGLSADHIYVLLKFVLNNSYFMYEDCHYYQIFGCPKGSPVGA
ncbi:Hypothetical predicted protein, partial [Paramuricea clavata]